MDELIKLVTQKASISEQQAKAAVDTVLGFVKDKLPPQFASQIDKIVQGGTPDLGGSLGGLFGKK